MIIFQHFLCLFEDTPLIHYKEHFLQKQKNNKKIKLIVKKYGFGKPISNINSFRVSD